MTDNASAVDPPVFQCIYCGHRKPASDFNKEHVFPRALCGTGANWTLENCVCKSCNNRFSNFENELLQQSAETIARGFSGPLGRNANSGKGARVQPLKINHLYVLNDNDTLVYEGGFSFPSEFYIRPQMVDVGDGTLLSLVTDRQEIVPFQEAITRFVSEPKRITLPRPPGRKEYEIVTFEWINNSWQTTTREMSKEPSDVFFREFIQRSGLPPMTARLAQNDDGRLFLRAADLIALGQFIDLIFANRPASPRPPLPEGPGHQTFFFGLQIDLIKVYKAVLKTGLNLVAHLYGANVVRDVAFDRARRILLEDIQTKSAASMCQLSADFSPDFPGSSTDVHQMMLDDFNGSLRFRMRLYKSFGYTATLGRPHSSLRTLIWSNLPRRVMIEYKTVGIHEVQSW